MNNTAQLDIPISISSGVIPRLYTNSAGGDTAPPLYDSSAEPQPTLELPPYALLCNLEYAAYLIYVLVGHIGTLRDDMDTSDFRSFSLLSYLGVLSTHGILTEQRLRMDSLDSFLILSWTLLTEFVCH